MDEDMEAGPSSELAVKVEDDVNIPQKIIDLCKIKASGVTDKMLQKEMADVPVLERANALNSLLADGKLELFKQGTQLLYRLKDSDRPAKVTDDEEKIVYSIIKEAGNKGIWIREIRTKSNLNQTILNKVIKVMEGKKIIKSIKAVNASKRKVYMLYELDPDRSVTGGSWYSTDQDFEVEFVDILNQQCYQFLKSKTESAAAKFSNPLEKRRASFASSDEVLKYIDELKISNVNLSVEDIESILETTIYDGLVEKSSTIVKVGGEHKSINTYRSVEPALKTTGLVSMPCGVCPVLKDCHVGGIISPTNCIYFNEWFEY
ncbi:DNA-directed RNA polymerase III subunit RPC6 [Halotydeus destructor]|nr:DNA-directed RNA polymerase III subunit RPC6 [Halotydeus destructor]